MRLRRVESVDLTATTRQPVMPAGMFKGIMLRYHGTAAAGVTVALADMGSIVLRHRGKAVQNWAIREAWLYTNLRGGRPEAVSAVGAAFSFSVILPLCYGPFNSYNMDDNVVNVRAGEMYLTLPGVAVAVATSTICDICVLEDVGTARYLPQIFATDLTSTTQNRIVVATPNLRHIIMTTWSGAAQPDSVMITRDRDVRVEGDWNQLLALTDIDSMVENAVATGAIMPDLGNNNPAVWTGGRQEVRITGASAASTSHYVEFGAEPVTPEEYLTVAEINNNMIAAGVATSPMPFAEIAAPIEARKAVSASTSMAPTPTVNVQVPQNRENAAVAAGPQPSARVRSMRHAYRR